MKKIIIVSGVVVVLALAAYVYTSSQPGVEPTPSPSVSVSMTPNATATPSSSPAAAVTSYTMATVALHRTSDDCWSAINGKVYDLGAWVKKHPGGSEAILKLCGNDGSNAFNRKHGGQQLQADTLAGFQIGILAQ